jgi:archaellum component FlaF (FlaF/FlaG flagellin family)
MTCKLTLRCTASGTLCNTHILHQGTEGAVDISYTVGGGSSTATINSDYTVNGSGVLRFEPRQTSASFTITILQDSLVSKTLVLLQSVTIGASDSKFMQKLCVVNTRRLARFLITITSYKSNITDI